MRDKMEYTLDVKQAFDAMLIEGYEVVDSKYPDRFKYERETGRIAFSGLIFKPHEFLEKYSNHKFRIYEEPEKNPECPMCDGDGMLLENSAVILYCDKCGVLFTKGIK